MEWVLPDPRAPGAAAALALPGGLRAARRRALDDRAAPILGCARWLPPGRPQVHVGPALRALVATPLGLREATSRFLAYGRAVDDRAPARRAGAALVPRRHRRRARAQRRRGHRRRAARARDRGRRRATGIPSRAAHERRGRTSRFYRGARLRGRARGRDAARRPARLDDGRDPPSRPRRRLRAGASRLARAAPKRFPDRDEIAAVRAEAERARARRRGAERAPPRRPRARRGATWGSSSSSTSSTAPAASSSSARRTAPGAVDVHLGDIVGVDRRARRKSRRGEPSLIVDRARAARDDPLAAAGHVPRPHRRRAALPPPLPRPADERGDARRLHAPRAHGHRDPARARRRRASSRSRRRCCSRATAARSRGRSSTHHNQLDQDALPAHRDRALPQAADRRRARARLRARQGLPQRGHLVQAQPRVHDARVVRGLRRLPRHDGADGAARRDGGARRRSARRRSRSAATRSTSAPLAARQARRRARRARPLDARRGRAARDASRRATSTRTHDRDLGAARRPRALALRRAAR